MPPHNPQPWQHAARLESLRGIAALVVAMFHCLLVLEGSHSGQFLVAPAIVIFNGRAAVTLFFVLSGLVLGMSLRRSTRPIPTNCTAYFIRRFFRIYPAYLVTTILVASLIPIYRNIPGTDSTWMNSYFPRTIEIHSIFQNLTFYNLTFNKVTWTLKMELICSFLLPICFYGHQIWRWFPWFLLGTSIAFAHHFHTVVSAAVGQAFLIGYLIPETERWWKWVEKRKMLTLLLLAAGLCCLMLPRSFHLYLPTITTVEAIGAALVIGSVTSAANVPTFLFLEWHPIKVIGQVSYSYYLIQPVVLFPVVAVLFPIIESLTSRQYPFVVSTILWMVSTIIALPLACISYKLIERPMINFSKSVLPRHTIDLFAPKSNHM